MGPWPVRAVSTAWAALSRNTSATPATNANATSAVTGTQPVATRANNTASIVQRARSASITGRRLGTRSTSAPMAGASNQATRPAAATTETQNTSPVTDAVSRGKVASRAPSPTELSAFALTSRRSAAV
ncbi:hypothetical protein ACIQU6_19970 [Streptomyces sp. NPDC090442]|uniref:hypothetical protein n=1 Tax=Streptomyces sp. NPDC090442 TaxID=3365962 RepID=UPI00381086D6